MCFRLLIYVFAGAVLFSSSQAIAQVSDSTEKKPNKKSLARKAYREGLSLISTTPKDPVKNSKSEDPFLLKLLEDHRTEKPNPKETVLYFWKV